MASRDPEATKERILAAAAARVLGQGHLRRARRRHRRPGAQVNKRMLYYYFESKEGLFREILRRRLAEGAAKLSASNVVRPGPARRTHRAPAGPTRVHAPH